MKLYVMAIVLLVACNRTPVFKTATPLDVAQSIFSKEGFPDVKKYAKGEYKGDFSGKNLPDSLTTKFTLLDEQEKTAVVTMTVLTPSQKGEDMYLYFEKDTVWKLNAIRELAMTGIIEEALAEMEKMTPQQIDEAIKNEQFQSKEDYAFRMGNAKLTLALDDDIIKHFLTHKAAFEKIKNAAYKELSNMDTDGERSIPVVENRKGEYNQLFIHTVSFFDYELGGKCLNFSIGGMVDNTVGYLYVTDKKDLPDMNPSRVIMLREIGAGWYIYKTT